MKCVKRFSLPWLALHVFAIAALPVIPTFDAYAAPSTQVEDPAEQCAEGIKLANEHKDAEAYPLLESGYYNRENGHWSSLNDIGDCAFKLAIMVYDYDLETAIEIFKVAYEYYSKADNHNSAANTLNSIGAMYYMEGDFSNALGYYKKGLALSREIRDVDGEITILGNISTLYSDYDQYSDALSYLNQKLILVKQRNDQESEADTLNFIGEMEVHLIMYDEALDHFQQALLIEEEINNQQGQANTLLGLGNLYEKQYQFNAAINYFQRALTIQESISDDFGATDSLSSLGEMYQAQGNYSEALVYYKDGLQRSRENDDRLQEAEILGNLGVLYGTQGQYGLALDYLHQSLGISQFIGDTSGEQATLLSLGAIQHRLEHYQEALVIYNDALDTFRKMGDRGGEAAALSAIGRIYSDQDNFDDADKYLLQALIINRERKSKAAEARSLYDLGNNQVGRDDELALSYFQQSLTIQQLIGDKQEEVNTLTAIGKLYYTKENYSEALDQFQESFVIAKEIGDKEGERINLTLIAYIYFDMKDYETGLVYYEQALEIFDVLRAGAGNESNKGALADQYTRLFTTGIIVNQVIGRGDQAFYLSESGRSRAFLDSISTGYVELSDDSAKSLFIQEHETYNRLSSLQEQLERARIQNSKDEALISSLEAEIDQANREHEEVLETIEARHDQLALLIPIRTSVLELSQVQSLLKTEETLISYWIGEDELVTFILTRNDFHIVNKFVSKGDVAQLITDFRLFSNLDDKHPQSSIALYQLLIEPIKEYVKTNELIIIPHNILNYLPFSGLTDGKDYLLDEYTIRYLPSASTLSFIQQDTESNNWEKMLVLGNPITNNYDTVSLMEQEPFYLSPLPFAEKEARVIANLFGTNAYIGIDATETIVKQEGPSANVIHLASHGLFNQGFPLNTFIALTPDQQNNGLLTVSEIYGLNLKSTNLVLLSACNTQIGQLSTGDEFFSLTRAFLFAGTPTVISSLWEVDDEATELLMEKFYKNWQLGMSKKEALRQAQIELRSENPNPYFWAGFVLNGDGGRGSESTYLPEETPYEFPNCMGGLSISFLLVAASINRFRKTR